MTGPKIPAGDPRIMESPVEAGLELASLTGGRLPGMKLRNARLLSLGVLWSASVILVAVLAVLSLWDTMESGEQLLSVAGLAYIALTLLFMPSVGFGFALIILAAKERQFLPFLEKASGAMTALEGRPPARQATAGGTSMDGGPLAGILGSAISVGSLVPTAERMAMVARGVLVLLILGLVFLPVLAAAGLIIGTFSVTLVALELVVMVVLAYPAASVFGDLSDDLRFYRYYSRRQRAITEIAAIGPAPVPEGPDPLIRFDRHLRAHPAIKSMLEGPGGNVEESPDGLAAARLYSGRGSGVLVRLLGRVPDTAALDAFRSEAISLAQKRAIGSFRAVALVGSGAPDVDDATYDHLVALGEQTPPGGCALQLVMEVEGTYSMVPFVAY
jgi:hypothetical protein